MTGPVDVGARIALLESRLAGLGARVNSRGGGRVGSGMEAAMNAAMADTAPAGAMTSSIAAPTARPTFAAAAAAAPSSAPTAAGAWSERLPTAGQRFAGDIEQTAARHGLDPSLLGALVWTESGFDPAAQSPAGAIGLGQLMPGTAAELGVDPQDPSQNLDGAARYLRTQLDRFGDTSLALAAYNAGPGRVAAAGGVPAIEETRNYVVRVTDRAATLRGTA